MTDERANGMGVKYLLRDFSLLAGSHRVDSIRCQPVADGFLRSIPIPMPALPLTIRDKNRMRPSGSVRGYCVSGIPTAIASTVDEVIAKGSRAQHLHILISCTSGSGQTKRRGVRLRLPLGTYLIDNIKLTFGSRIA